MNNLVFNFDNWSLGDLIVGQKLPKSYKESDLVSKEKGYDIYTKNNKVTGIFACLRSGYRGYDKFQGSFISEQNVLDSFGMTQPGDILVLFGKPYRQWDDGSEISMEYEDGEFKFEFVWRIKEDKFQLNYVMVEL